ncbi:MAG: hypothetical protein Kow0088_24270 [Anaerolineales bacterium]
MKRKYGGWRLRKGQGLVEFALILPLLLLLIFGVIEMGRAFYIYIIVTSTSREAARYGSAVGVSENGVPYYRDCAGIRQAANRIAILANIPDQDIVIEYVHPDGTTYGSCAPGTAMGPASTELGDRIVVRVKGIFHSIVPLQPLRDFDIHSRTVRTIIKDVRVGAADLPLVFTPTQTQTPTETQTPLPTDTPTSTPTPTETPTPTTTPTSTPTPTNTSTPTVTNTPTPGPSSTPTNTPTPTSTASPTATPTPTATATPICYGLSIALGEPSGNKLELRIENGQSAPIRVESLTISLWPNGAEQNKYLEIIRMNGSEIWSGTKVNYIPIVIGPSQWYANTSEIRQVNALSTGFMQFFFEKDALPSGYNLTVTFDNGCSRNTTR